jgi:hypothetical protein
MMPLLLFEELLKQRSLTQQGAKLTANQIMFEG